MRQILLVSVVCVVAVAAPVFGGTNYSFHPSVPDLGDLDHSKVYTWGVDWTSHNNESIASASLVIDDLKNWQTENDVLYIHILDNPALGIRTITDPVSYNQDYFAGQGVLLTAYRDSTRPANMPSNWWTYTFTASDLQVLSKYASDGRFGFGFDPDCHYYNSGVSLMFNTQSVPEPMTALLVAPVLALIRRSRNRRWA